MIVQIYEIEDPREAELCLEAGVDRLGSVVLSEDEWRTPVLKETVRMIQRAGKESSLIPLFKDQDNIFRSLDYYAPDYVHFCDNLVSEKREIVDLQPFIHLQEGVRKYFPEIGVIRSIPLPREGTEDEFPLLELSRTFESLSTVFLTDTWLKEEPVAGFIGITGQTVDWEMATELAGKSPIPVILAGGLSPANVHEAILKVRPAGVDSCTLTNRLDAKGNPIRFRKDAGKVRDFVQEVRMAEATIRGELVSRLSALKEELREREAALPAHSVRPHQLQVIEALEEEINELEEKIRRLEGH
jgi:phosphoribosylanthranilate isomerase